MFDEGLATGGQLAEASQALDAPPALDPAYAQFRDQTRFWVQRVAVPMIMVVGLFGNLITVIIMTRRRMRSTTNMYLAALAFVDMLYLVLTFVLGLSHYPNMARKRYYFYWRLRPFLMMLTDACSNTSVWLTVTFTIERFIAVRYPMKGKVWCTEARAKRLIVCVFLFGILFALPVPFEWKVVERRAPGLPAGGDESAPTLTAAVSSSPLSSIVKQRGGDGNVEGQPMASSEDKPPPPLLPPTTLPSSPSFGLQPTEPVLGRSSAPAWVATSAAAGTTLLELNSSAPLKPAPNETGEGEPLLGLENTEVGSNENYKTIYYWSTAAIFYFIPLLSLTFFNGFLIHSVHKSRRKRNEMTNRSQATFSSDSELWQARQRANLATGAAAATAFSKCAGNTNNTNEVKFKLSPLARPLSQPPHLQLAERQAGRPPSESIGEGGAGEELELVGDGGGGGGGNNEARENRCDKEGTKAANTSKAPSVADVAANSNGARASHKPALPSSNNDHASKVELGSESLDSTSNTETRALTVSGTDESAGAESTTASQTNKPDLAARNRVSEQPEGAGAGADPVKRLNLGPRDSSSARSPLARSLAEFSGGGGTNGLRGRRDGGKSVQASKSFGQPNVAGKPERLSASSSCSAGGQPQQQQHPHQMSGSSQERRITIMLISVVILFLVCQIPSAAMILYTSVHEAVPNTNEHALVLAFGNIFNFLMAINAAGNFILYSFLSKKYRRTFVSLFCACLSGSRRRSSWLVYYQAPNSSAEGGAVPGPGDDAVQASRKWTSFRFAARPVVATTSSRKEPTPNALRGQDQVAAGLLQAKSPDREHKRRDTLV